MRDLDKSKDELKKGAERMARMMAEREQRFRRVFDEGPLGMALVGKDYRFLQVNNKLCEIVGYTETELTQLGFPDITHPEDLGKDIELAEQVFRGDLPSYQIEKRYIAKGQDIVWIHLTASVIRDEQGEPMYGLAMIEDITERKRSEEVLRKYESMVSASRDLMVFVDTTYTYRAVNAAYCEAHRKTREEILGHSVASVLGQEIFETTLKANLDRCLAGEQMNFEFWWDSPALGRRYVDARYDPFYEADGSVSGVLVDVRDNTDQKQAEEALREARRMKAIGQIALTVRHHVNNALTTILLSSQRLASEGSLLTQDHREMVQEISKAARRIAQDLEKIRNLKTAPVTTYATGEEMVDLAAATTK